MDLTKLVKVDDEGSPGSDGTPDGSRSRRSRSRSGSSHSSSSGKRKASTMGGVSVGMALLAIVLAIIGVPAKHAAGYGTAVIVIILMCCIAALCVVGMSVAIMGIASKRRSPILPLLGLALNPAVAIVFAVFLWWPTPATLLSAAENGDAEGVDRAVSMGVKVNDVSTILDRDQNRFTGTPLIAAALNGQKSTVASLLAHGADVNAVDSLNRTALYHAVSQGHGDVASVLVTAKADPNLSPDSKGPLYFAVAAGNAPLVEQMLRENAQPNNAQHPPLLVAAGLGHTKIAEMLLDRKADVNAVDDEGDTALHIAAAKGHQYVAKLMLRKEAKTSLRNKHGETALERAIEGNHKPIVDDLLNVGSPIDLFAAIGLGDLDRVMKELDSTPKLVKAIRRGLTPLHLASKRGRIEIVSLLIERGADPNAKVESINGTTPLYLATVNGHVEVGKILVANKVDVNQIVSIDGTTAPPLYFAAIDGFNDMVDVLLAAGADVNIRCQAPPEPTTTIPVVGSPLTFAVIHKRHAAAQRLLEAKADPDFRSRPDGPTPLYEAVRNADLEMVTLLIRFKANVNAQVNGSSILTVIEASQRGHQKAESLDRIYSLLRDNGALD